MWIASSSPVIWLVCGMPIMVTITYFIIFLKETGCNAAWNQEHHTRQIYCNDWTIDCCSCRSSFAFGGNGWAYSQLRLLFIEAAQCGLAALRDARLGIIYWPWAGNWRLLTGRIGRYMCILRASAAFWGSMRFAVMAGGESNIFFECTGKGT